MGFLDRWKSQRRQEQLTDRQAYAALLARESQGKLSPADDRRLAELVEKLRLSPDDVGSHLDVLRRANESSAIVARNKSATDNLHKAEQELAAFNAEFTQVRNTFVARGVEIQQRFDQALGIHEQVIHAEAHLADLKETYPLVFGMPEKAPPTPMSPARQREEQRRVEEHPLVTSVAAALRDALPVRLTQADLDAMERAAARGEVDDVTIKKARKCVVAEAAA